MQIIVMKKVYGEEHLLLLVDQGKVIRNLLPEFLTWWLKEAVDSQYFKPSEGYMGISVAELFIRRMEGQLKEGATRAFTEWPTYHMSKYGWRLAEIHEMDWMEKETKFDLTKEQQEYLTILRLAD